MDNRDYYTLEAMDKWGGSFLQALAQLARHADPSNFQRIKDTWSGFWKVYEKKGIELEKERKGN